jgi:hypothetical protein
MKIPGRRIHIAGSANPGTSPATLRYAHELVGHLAARLAGEGARFVLAVGKEPLSDAPDSLPIVFDWTVLGALHNSIQRGKSVARSTMGALVESLATHKTDGHIPSIRRQLWTEIKNADAVHLEFLAPGWTSGAIRRERQAQLGDVLITVSGGEGVEHLARDYINHGKAVIALDLQLGSSTDDGSGGSVRLAAEALHNPRLFVRIGSNHSAQALLDRISTRGGTAPACAVVDNIVILMSALEEPHVFYVRLLDEAAPEYGAVEEFFRAVVDPVVTEMGFRPLQMARGKSEHAWMDQAIFESLHYSETVVVDLTGVRPNCFMELGYALGNRQRTAVTAMEGTKVPFDPSAIERYVWSATKSDGDRQRELKDYWLRTIDRPNLVSLRR